MELSVKELDLPSATEIIPEDGADPYRMIQVHDYLNVSFLRMDPNIRAASKETIQIFSMAYPELLKVRRHGCFLTRLLRFQTVVPNPFAKININLSELLKLGE